jgi:cell fate regulator YaaT (PSP1 superfamily)
MPGSITPLPIMLDEEDQKVYDRLQPPSSIVVRYGSQKLVAELPYDGDDKPGCGSKLVVRTPRGIELGEMLTTTCPNSGCSKSVSRKEMLQYIDNSGGRDFPFTTQGKVLRVATLEDLHEQSRLDAQKSTIIRFAKVAISRHDLPMKLVDVELLLGGERIIFFYTSENWVDFRELVKDLAAEYQTRIEMHQVNAREEARLVADYERCGQYCCCKNFLKVLKPVSMRSAKVQKATLDPTKISGRCGRLMCCLRYEDETYEDLRKRLPHRKTVVETEDGIGEVQDTQILTQLVLVRVPGQPGNAAYPLENLRVLSKEESKAWHAEQRAIEKDRVEREAERAERRAQRGGYGGRSGPPPRRRDGTSAPAGSAATEAGAEEAPPAAADESIVEPPVSRGYGNPAQRPPEPEGDASGGTPEGDGGGKKRRRRRRRGRGRGGPGGGPTTGPGPSDKGN